MAYIRKLPSGKWQATVRGPDGKKHTHTDRLRGNVSTWAHIQEAGAARFRETLIGHPVMTFSADGTPSAERPWRGSARERWDAFDPHGFFVYFLWGDDPDDPIYIGKSSNVFGRIGDHVYSMGHLIERVTLVRCPGEREMGDTETRLIALYKPRLNCAGVRARPPRYAVVEGPPNGAH